MDHNGNVVQFDQLLAADELGVRLEIVGGLPIWEAQPGIHGMQMVNST